MAEGGDLRMTQIIAPPRTLSTALEIALAEGASGQVHEPFHRGRVRSFEEGCDGILKRVQQLRGQIGSPIHIVSKDLAKYIQPGEWEELLEHLVSTCVVLVREPSLQFRSLIRRRVNDLIEHGTDKLSEEEVLAGAATLPSSAWMDNSWRHSDLFLEMAEQNPKVKTAAVSALVLSADPEEIIRRLFGIMGFNGEVKPEWSAAVGERFYSAPFLGQPGEREDEGELGRNRWYSAIMNSRGFIPLSRDKDRPLDIAAYSEEMRKYFNEEIIPRYLRILRSRSFLKPNTENFSQISNSNSAEAYVLARLSGCEDLGEIEKQLISDAPVLFEVLKRSL